MSELQGSKLIIDDKTLPVIESICDGMPGGFFIYKAEGEGEIIYINKAMLKVFGCDTEQEFKELTGNTFRGIVHPEDFDAIQKSIDDQILNTPDNFDYVEYRITRKDGSVRWVEDYGKYVTNDHYGGLFFVFIDDATERLRERMQTLEQINNELKTINAHEMQYRKAILHNANTFFEVNLSRDEFISTVGHSNKKSSVDLFDFIGMSSCKRYSDYLKALGEKIGGEDCEKFIEFFSIERLTSCYENGKLERIFECKLSDRNGRERLFQFICLIGKNNFTEELVALFIAKDITKQNKKRKLFQIALQEANAANIARQTFLDNMSHEIRTPLNSIIGFTELIKEHSFDIDKMNHYLENIKLSSQQLLKIVNESLALTHIESGKAVLTKADCNLSELFDSLYKRIVQEAADKNINLLFDTEHVHNFSVCTDMPRLEEMLWQLLDNAIKYTDEGGRVTLRAVQELDAAHGFGHYFFTVEDNGCGIEPELTEVIFDPFRRVENTTTSGVFGSGLGLAVVKNILDMMNGKITLDSKVGEGSSFTVELTFPLCCEEKTTKPLTEMDSDDMEFMNHIHVLVVEDNPINLEIEQSMLEYCGCTVSTAENGKEAVEKISALKKREYDLVLMDIQMPVMDGYEATREIRKLENPELAEIPIIAVSANAFEEDRENALKSGMNAHFPKPIDINALKVLIRKILLG